MRVPMRSMWLVLLVACGEGPGTDAGDLDAAVRDAPAPTDAPVEPVDCAAGCVYVRSGATGDGGDWANALPAIPDTLERGATYLLAAGSYGPLTLDDAERGADPIAIVRATAGSHGTDVGWDPAYGEGAAELEQITFATGHYRIDGRTGGGSASWASGFGIRVHGGGHNLHFEGPVGFVTVRHVDVENLGRMHASNGNDVSVYAIGGAHDLVFDHDAFHDVNGVQYLTREADGILLEQSLLARNGPVFDMCADGPCHREAWSASTDDHVTIRSCRFEDISNTAFVFLGNGTGEADGWDLTGNVFWYSGTLDDVGVSALIDVDTPRGIVVRNWTFSNNTIAFVTGLSAAIRAPDTAPADLVLRNNVWLGNEVNTVASDGDRDHGLYVNNLRTEGCPTPCDLDVAAMDEAHGVNGDVDPFVDAARGDFHLTGATEPGEPLDAAHGTDPDGAARGEDGVWDRGAYER